LASPLYDTSISLADIESEAAIAVKRKLD